VIKKIFKAIGLMLGLFILVSAGIVVSDLTYWKRLFTAPMDEMVTAVDWYGPLEALSGSAPTAELPAGPAVSITPAALQAAIAYGTETESVSLLVYHRGQLVLEHYWPGFGPDTRTDPASMHKSVLAMAVGLAIGDGLIDSVDAPASRWLTEWQGDERATITVKDLLTMSSGLALVPFSPNPFGNFFKFLLGTDIEAATFAVGAAEAPGTFAYSNINAQSLGILLQRAVGRRYADFVDEKLWSKLNAGPAYVWLDRDGGMARTFCCIQTTARGWLQVGRLILGRGTLDGREIVPREWIEAMTTPSAANPNYGYQIWLGQEYERERMYNATTPPVMHSEPFVVEDLIYLDGFGGQRVYVSPSQELVIVRTGKAQLGWDDARLPNTIIRGVMAAAPRQTGA
jgi:CubicO group peptidase (beta-lactamase class C family)